jgi:hypothetical protein
VGVVAKFLNAELPFVGRRVLSESTTRFADLPTLVADPGATGGSCHGGETGGGKSEELQVGR